MAINQPLCNNLIEFVRGATEPLESWGSYEATYKPNAANRRCCRLLSNCKRRLLSTNHLVEERLRDSILL